MAGLAVPLRQLFDRVRSATPRPAEAVQDTLRTQLFTAEQMRAHGRALAARHTLAARPPGDRLLNRLGANAQVLSETGRLLAATLAAGRSITPAGEWLLDNLYLTEQEITTARRHLPRGYGRELPRLADDAALYGPAAGRPRVYDLALNAVGHSDGQLAVDTLAGFIAAYQQVQPLTLGELWAFPIMLRLALIENLRRAAVDVADAQAARDAAEIWATRMLAVADERPSDLVLVVADLARSDVELSIPFIAELARRLQGRGTALGMPLSWIEQRLADQGRTVDAMLQQDSRTQAGWQLTVANSIGSLRLVGATDWPGFVEAASGVEQTLRGDPAGVYAQMDFASRDRYRHAVERLARLAKKPERDVARHVVGLAADTGAEARAGHIGHFLVGPGQPLLRRSLGLQPLRDAAALERIYLRGGALLTLLLATLPAWQLGRAHTMPHGLPSWALVLLALPLLVSASALAMALLNWLATLFVGPQALPRLDYKDGIAADAPTLVVVPTLLSSLAGADELVAGLEVHFLANRDPMLRYALLTDLRDADARTEPGDAALVDRAAAGIAALNVRYPRDGDDGDNFFLFHRERRWNDGEGRWMGHERKRGKLAALNAMLRGAPDAFDRAEGGAAGLAATRYVITLDTDTELPHGSASLLVATMAHPLQKPVLATDGARAGVVVAGHAILQPRTAASLPSVQRSRHAQLFAGDAGIDPYTRAVSDVYQDLFDEGSYVGKGIYDVDAFESALHGRLPDNRILSHDLIEGSHARAGLISDVTLFEPAPARHAGEAARVHRWTRGDWQLLPWLFQRVGALPGRPLNPLSTLSQWKLLDNLRRSLVAPSLLVMLLAGWAASFDPYAWTLDVLVVLGCVPLATPLIAHALALWHRWREGVPVASGDGPPSLGATVVRVLHRVALLPDEARIMVDAIVRTGWRLAVTRRGLLEWTASAHLPAGAAAGSRDALREALWERVAGPLFALLAGALLVALRPAALPAAAPVLLLWLLSPVIVWWLDQPPRPRHPPLPAADRLLLRSLARRTWAFFEEYVGAGDNFLPPDNVQFEPTPRVAHRTSPTNIGFALLTPFAARDLGYLTPLKLLDRVEATLDTLDQMERYQGHFFNWYDTQTLQPLLPRYVSSVDSGNLAACLRLVRSGLQQMADEPFIGSTWCDGLVDTLALLRAADGDGSARGATAQFEQHLNAFCKAPPQTPAALHAAFDALHLAAAAVLAAVAGQAGGAAVREMASAPLHWAGALVRQCRGAAEELAALVPPGAAAEGIQSLRALAGRDDATPVARSALERIERIGERALAMSEMDYAFLYDSRRKLLAIGWHVDDNRRDAGHYDLLASEARLGVYIAIAQGQLPAQAWFALGRGLSSVHGKPVLLSWSGSMFEYLMPALVMPQFEGTLLDTSCRTAVQRQIDDGSERGVPWGVSESGYNATDSALNYQYRAFGVPGLGLKRGLAEDLVVAPYATMMALVVDPVRAAANLRRLDELGAIGDYGCYEAIDFTPSRLPPGATQAIVRSHMAHHQGMGFLGLAQVLAGPRMQQRFEADAALRAALPLLHEKSPTGQVLTAASADRAALRVSDTGAEDTGERIFQSPDTRMPEVQLLSNGRYHLMLTQAGGGSSRWKNLGLTRWREDATTDAWGSWCYLRDADGGRAWSAAHQPTAVPAARSLVVFSESRADYRRVDHGIESRTSIAVSPEDDIELRRVRLRSTTRQRRRVELTSCLEVSLAGVSEDAQHPAFSKLFVQTELLPELGAILCRRRPRAAGEHWPWMFHLLVVRDSDARPALPAELSFETDRMRFVGRGRSMADPVALDAPGPLSNTAGNVLDPVAAGRCTLVVEPDRTRIVDLVTGVADSRDACLALIDKYRDRRLADRVFELAWTHAQVLLRQLEVSAAEAQLYARIAGVLVFSQSTLRADDAVIRQNRRGQSGLWGYSISGDLPIVLLTVSDVRSLPLVRQLVLAHTWWRLKGLAVDLVIWNEEHDTYRQRLHEQILGMVAARPEFMSGDQPPGGVFVRHVDQVAPDDRVLMLSVARAVFSDQRGTLAEQLQRGAFIERRRGAEPSAPRQAGSGAERRRTLLEPTTATRNGTPAPLPLPSLQQANGYGGLATGGREYVVAPPPGQTTPAPWVNVLANPRLGTVVSESGGAYTWFGNAHEYRLTPWHNDPVSDTCGEAIYIRDDDSGAFWTPTALPAGSQVRARHGFGRSVFEQRSEEIATTLTLFVAADAPVRFAVLELRNESRETRRLSATGYVEWVLGSQRATTAPHIVTERSEASGALLARNAFGPDNGNVVAFFAVDALHANRAGYTCDRLDFIGRNRSLRDPVALHETRLSRRAGVALDPCAALQVPVLLTAGEVQTVVFRLGAGDDMAEAEGLVARHAGPDAWRAALAAVDTQWRGLLGTLQVKTPMPQLDALANGWLVYQVIACRYWARSGYYQSGGAYGFRDQLQDTMALVHAAPQLLREQIARSAGRQFPEGDVQHWWHPGAGRGVRTHCSDDYLWLPLALVRHWRATGDTALHDEVLPFIECRAPVGEEEAVFDQPQISGQSGTVYEHARLALQFGFRYGPHGLPLMGAGDWNDGMNRVGHAGVGESVWLAFFLVHVLEQFEPLARSRGDSVFAERCAAERAGLAARIEEHAWDGGWYRRAWFDDGTPLGSATSPECSIDLIAQSWSVLSGVAPPERATMALDAARTRLVDREAGLVRLLEPAFDGKGPDPGYIAGYVPGVRENGGQYTHGAIWAAMAMAEAGRVDDAWELFAMINPLNHARDAAEVQRYKVEPWVVSADVYGVAPHTGRGGWSWYTGSAGWMYRLVVETLLGITREVDADGTAWLCLAPRLPHDWPGYTFTYRLGASSWSCRVERRAGAAAALLLDGQALAQQRLPLRDDGGTHQAVLTLPA